MDSTSAMSSVRVNQLLDNVRLLRNCPRIPGSVRRCYHQWGADQNDLRHKEDAEPLLERGF